MKVYGVKSVFSSIHITEDRTEKVGFPIRETGVFSTKWAKHTQTERVFYCFEPETQSEAEMLGPTLFHYLDKEQNKPSEIFRCSSYPIQAEPTFFVVRVETPEQNEVMNRIICEMECNQKWFGRGVLKDTDNKKDAVKEEEV